MDAPRIEPREVRRRLDAGEKVIFLDARNEEDYQKAKERLPGAMRVPSEDAELYANDLPGNALIVSYCT
jgi:rhodanese-related sulfurtransferase